MEVAALLALLSTVDSGAPTGAFTGSWGWETAVRQGWLRDPVDAESWLLGAVVDDLGCIELPHLVRAHRARTPWAADAHLERYVVVPAWGRESRRAGGRLLELAGQRAAPCHRAVATGVLLALAGVDAVAAAAAHAHAVCLGQAQVGVRLGVLTADEAVALVRHLASPIGRVAAAAADARVRAPGSFRHAMAGQVHARLAAPLFSS